MAIEAAAAAVVSGLLAPLVSKGVSALAETVGGALGQAAGNAWSERASSAWAKLRGKFATGSDQVALEEFDKAPDSDDAQLLFKMKLRDKLAEDPGLAEELHGLLGQLDEARATAISDGAHVSDVTGDVGIADARHGDFRGATGTTIIGLRKGSGTDPD